MTITPITMNDTQPKQLQQPDSNGHQPHEPAQDMFSDVPLAKRAHRWVERTPAGMVIDITSAGLSLLTVVTYMVETHYPNSSDIYLALRNVDLACCAVFAAEWAFWLWLAQQRRLRYVVSLQSIVDILTIAPTAVSSLVNTHVPAFSAFEAMVRVLRVLRVFRIFRLGRRLHSEVQARLLMLACTLAAIIVTAASLFYEIETRFGSTYPDLTIERSIYWGAVTITTIGYGDYSPSVLASQMMVIGVLAVTFTVLPYQTNALVGALSAANPYSSAKYSPAAKGRHVVVTGHLDAELMQLLVEELYHDDYGFHDYCLVFLRPARPTPAMRRLLKVHPMRYRLRYLQGSAASAADLARAQVQHADAVFVMADKSPGDAHEEDLRNSTCCLAIGHFLYAMACTDSSNNSSQGHAGKAVRCLPKMLSRLLTPAWLRQRQRHLTTPLLCIQLLLPGSRQRLTSWLQRYADLPEQTDDPQVHSSAKGAAPAAAGSHLHDTRQQRQQPDQAEPSSDSACSDAGRFWQGFAQSLAVVCAADITYGLMGAACVTPGVITLLSNLVRNVSASSLPASELARLPGWARQYLAGAGHELYEVPLLPQHMWGHRLAAITQYLQQYYAAITIAAAGSLPPPSNQPAGSSPHNTITPAAAHPNASCNASSENVEASCRLLAVLGRGGVGSARDCRPMWLAPLDHSVLPGTSLYVIAQDLRVVLDIMQGSPGQFQQWLAQQQQQQQQQQQAKLEVLQQNGELPDQLQPPDQQCRRTQPLSPHQQQQQQQQQQQEPAAAPEACRQPSTAAAGPLHSTPAAAAVPTSQACAAPHEHSPPPAAAPAPATPTAAAAAAARQNSSTVLNISQLQQPLLLWQQQQATSQCSDSSSTAALLNRGSQLVAAAAPGAANSQPGFQDRSSGGAHHSSGTQHPPRPRHRRKRQAVQLNTHALAAPGYAHVSGAAMALRSRAALQSQATTQLRQARSSGRRGEWRAAAALQQRLYHTRQLGRDGAADHLQGVYVDVVDLTGHILVAGHGLQPSALLALLAPLRSTALANAAPLVLLDAAADLEGPEWADVASLCDVFIIRGSVHDPHALMAANAERAAVAVLLQPRSSSTPGSGSSCASCTDDSMSAVGPADARIVAAANTLSSINPNIQLFVELGLPSSVALLSPTGSLLSWRAAESSRAAASPAFLPGGVLMPALLDYMVCQTLYNHATPRIVSQLLSQWHSQAGGQVNPHDPSPADAAGVVAEAAADGKQNQCEQELNNAMLTQQQQQQQQQQQPQQQQQQQQVTDSKQGRAAPAAAADLASQQQGATSILQHAGGAVLLQVPVSQCSGCATFGELFGWLLQRRGMVAAGLQRSAVHQGRSLRYVYTNPDQDTQLCDTDTALVLLPHTAGSSSLPADAVHSWGS